FDSPAPSRLSGVGCVLRSLRAQRLHEIVEIRSLEFRAEVRDAVEDLDRFEIVRGARGMNEPRRREAILLAEGQRDSARLRLEDLAAAAAVTSAGLRTLRAVDPRQPAMSDAVLRGRDQRRDRRLLARAGDLEKRLRALVWRAPHVKPERHLAFAERVRLPLAETQLVLVDLSVAAAALRARAGGGFDHVRHDAIIG